jgi:hypothetical protein
LPGYWLLSCFRIKLCLCTAQENFLQKIEIVRLYPRFDRLVPLEVKIERIAVIHKWVEGPVWNRREGYLLFSDVAKNSVYKWQHGKGESLFLKPSGYTGKALFDGLEQGSNGLVYDLPGRLVLAEHGDRRIAPGQRVRHIWERFEPLDLRHQEANFVGRVWNSGALKRVSDGSVHNLPVGRMLFMEQRVDHGILEVGAPPPGHKLI